jgi:hypothetical protein
MDLKDLQSLVGLNPEFAIKVQRALETVRAGKLPEFVDPSKHRETMLADMRERLRGLRAAREESALRFEESIRAQEDAIARLEQEIGAPAEDRGRAEERSRTSRDQPPLRSSRRRRGEPEG